MVTYLWSKHKSGNSTNQSFVPVSPDAVLQLNTNITWRAEKEEYTFPAV